MCSLEPALQSSGVSGHREAEPVQMPSPVARLRNSGGYVSDESEVGTTVEQFGMKGLQAFGAAIGHDKIQYSI